MDEFKLTTPVTFIFFNRLDCASETFASIKKAKPSKLFLVSDGPRESRIGEKDKVNEVRNYIESQIDWDCEVYKNYAETNLGVKQRIYSGINWTLEHEESTIILEDDCVASQDFYRFCQETLELYKNDTNVWMISGLNRFHTQNSKDIYFFSKFASGWGWATWRRAWSQIDIEMDTWEQVKKDGSIKYAYDWFSYRCFLRVAKNQVENHRDTWDVPWPYTIIKNHGVGIVPRENMIKNVGCGHPDASNTPAEEDIDFSYGQPMKFPIEKIYDMDADMGFDKKYLSVDAGIKKEIKYILYCFTRIIPKLKKIINR